MAALLLTSVVNRRTDRRGEKVRFPDKINKRCNFHIFGHNITTLEQQTVKMFAIAVQRALAK